jgi:glycosyltransferase involved in cell wall biosynthesis
MEEITLIIPVFNEEGNIHRIWFEVEDYRKKSKYEIFTLFVNDGSTDDTLYLVKEVCTMNDGFGFISFQTNRGLSAAIKAGIDFSKTKWVGYMDGDLQTSPSDFLKFEDFLDSYDLVTGERQDRKDRIGKKMSSSFANWIRDSFLHDGMKDTGCPLKIFKREFALKIPYFNGFHRFFPALTQIYGGKVKVIPVNHFPRTEGKSKFNAFNRILGPMMDMFLVYRLKKRRIIYTVKESSIFQTQKVHE